MHVGVCMKIDADDLESAKEIATGILHEHSIDEQEDTYETDFSLEEFMKCLFPEIEYEENNAKLFLEVIESYEEPLRKILDMDIDCDLADLIEYEKQHPNLFLKKLIQSGLEVFGSDEGYGIFFKWFDEPWEHIDIELKENSHGYYIAVTTSYYMSKGSWDYSYGISESFGVHDNNKLRIFTSKATDNVNNKLIDILRNPDVLNETEKKWVVGMIDFYVDEDENIEDYPSLDYILVFLTENITDRTYFITGSVHI